MGYQVSVTPLQMATAASAVANGGLLMEPHVVRAFVRDGRREVVQPKVLRRAISAETAATMTSIMEAVVSSRGTANSASLEGYQVAGKTGTSHKAVAHGYSATDYNASFVGFVPSRRPAFTILVVIDTPRANGHYGGVVAAPIFKRIAEAALRQAGVPPTVNPAPPVMVAETFPELPARPPAEFSVLPALAPIGGPTLMPDVRGLSARDGLRVLSGAGLSVRTRGDGFVVRQSPEPGAPVDVGDLGVIELRRSAPEASTLRGFR
jgi:membrane peptidoglycan carboxypeptidase